MRAARPTKQISYVANLWKIETISRTLKQWLRSGSILLKVSNAEIGPRPKKSRTRLLRSERHGNAVLLFICGENFS